MTFETYFRTCAASKHIINQSVDGNGNVTFYIYPQGSVLSTSSLPTYKVKDNTLIEVTPLEDVE